MKKYLIVYIIICYFIANCSNGKFDNNFNKDDIVEFSLDYIVSNKESLDLPIDYLKQPLKIVVTEAYRPTRNILVNKFNCEVIKEEDRNKIIQKMDVFKPVPMIEIMSLYKENDTTQIDIILRATGHNFIIKITGDDKSSYRVANLKHQTI